MASLFAGSCAGSSVRGRIAEVFRPPSFDQRQDSRPESLPFRLLIPGHEPRLSQPAKAGRPGDTAQICMENRRALAGTGSTRPGWPAFAGHDMTRMNAEGRCGPEGAKSLIRARRAPGLRRPLRHRGEVAQFLRLTAHPAAGRPDTPGTTTHPSPPASARFSVSIFTERSRRRERRSGGLHGVLPR